MRNVERRVEPEGMHRDAATLDMDGLPHIGAAIWPGQNYYNTLDNLTGKGCIPMEAWTGCGVQAHTSEHGRAPVHAGRSKAGKLKGEETAVVEQVTIVGSAKDKNIKQANIKLRFNRNPVVGVCT